MQGKLVTIFWCLFMLVSLPTCLISQEAEKEIRWYTLDEATALSEKEPRKLFIDIMTVWCGWCKKMDREVFNQPQVISVINKSYYAVKLDAQQTETIKFNGNTYEYKMYGQKGFNEFAVELLRGRMGFPSLVFLDEDLKIIQALEGFQKTERLALILNYFGEDDYKKIPWTAYTREYELNLKKQNLNLKSIQTVKGNNNQ